MVYRVTKEIRFCYAHRLLDYEGPCAHLHGHNARVEIELSAPELDERGMVFEFSELKEVLQGWMDNTLDHRTLLREDDPLANLLQEIGEPVYLMKRNPTAEAIAEEIYLYARQQDLPVSQVKVWETCTACAVYTEKE